MLSWVWITENIDESKIVNFLSITLNIYVLGAQKNCLTETVLLSTHNICFSLEIRKLIFNYALVSKGLCFANTCV